MMRATTGHPVRAFAGLVALLAAWLGARLPAMHADFTTGLEQARAGLEAQLRQVPARSTRLRERAAVPVTLAASPPRIDARHSPMIAVLAKVDSDFRDVRKTVSRDHDDNTMELATAPSNDLAAVPRLVVERKPPSVSSFPQSAAAFASAGYDRLAAGDRRAGARLLATATVIGGDPRAAAWSRDRDALFRRWSGNAYVIARGSGVGDLAATPVLGGGQAGAALGYTPDPLARRPVVVGLRATAATRRSGIDGDAAQAAFGVTWRVLPSVSVSAERLVPLGDATRGAWALRMAGGTSGRRLGIDASIYAEAGRVGGATYAAAQARGDMPLRLGAAFTLHPGGGIWASLQHDARTIGRIDAGPGIRITSRALPAEVSVDYRARVAGNAAPGSGPVVTVSTNF